LRRIKTVPEKIDELIASYEMLNREAHDMLDLYIDEARLAYPSIPIGQLKQLAFVRAGSSMNMIAALRILKERKCSLR